MSADTTMHVETSGKDTVFTRLIAAPRARVFRAWTDPKHLSKWWGPHSVTCPICEVDLRPGGRLRLVMRSPEGSDYPLTGVYREIVEPERIVCSVDTSEHSPEWHAQLSRHRPGGGRAATEMLWTVSFEEYNGKTKLTIRTHFASLADRDAFINMGMSEGWSQSLERLETLLAKA